MKKLFVVTDNLYIFKEFKKIINNREDVLVDYFCSKKSEQIFKHELSNEEISLINFKKDNIESFQQTYDLGISCHSKQLFPASLVNSITCINIHPGLNPYNRGWYPQVFSIINNLPAGATIHIMDEKIDHGDIIVQEKIQIYSYETSIDAYNKVLKKEIELFEYNINEILLQNYHTFMPNSEGNYNSIQDYKDLCKVDLERTLTMREAIDYLRAMTHPPYLNSYFIDKNGDKIYLSLNIIKEEHDEN